MKKKRSDLTFIILIYYIVKFIASIMKDKLKSYCKLIDRHFIYIFLIACIYFIVNIANAFSSPIHNDEEIIGKNNFKMSWVYAKFRDLLEKNEDYRLKTYRNHINEPYTACYGFTYIYYRKADGKVEPCGVYLKDIILTPQFCDEQLKLAFDYDNQQLYKEFTLEDKKTGKKSNRYNQMTNEQLVGMLDLIHHNGRTGIRPVVVKMRIYLRRPNIANQIEVQKAIMFKLKQGSHKTKKGFNARRDRIIKLMFS